MLASTVTMSTVSANVLRRKSLTTRHKGPNERPTCEHLLTLEGLTPMVAVYLQETLSTAHKKQVSLCTIKNCWKMAQLIKYGVRMTHSLLKIPMQTV